MTDADCLLCDVEGASHEPMPGGAQRIVSRDCPELPREDIDAVMDRVRELLSQP